MAQEEVEKIEFLMQYLNTAQADNDAYSVAWVSIQIGINPPHGEGPIMESIPLIREKLERTLLSTRTATKFGI